MIRRTLPTLFIVKEASISRSYFTGFTYIAKKSKFLFALCIAKRKVCLVRTLFTLFIAKGTRILRALFTHIFAKGT